MQQFGFSLVVIGLFAVAAVGQDKDAITLKIAFPKAGQRARVTVEDKTTTKTEFTVGGMAQSKEEVRTKSLEYVDEVIENPNMERKATKLNRFYKKAVVGKDGNSMNLPIEGKMVLIEKRNGKYSYSVDGQAITGESLKLLEEEFSKPNQKDPRNIMLPKTMVKPGDNWKIDATELIKVIGSEGLIFDKDKLTATGKLLKAFKMNGKQYGVIEFVLDVPITGFGGKAPLKVKEGKMMLLFTGDGCIDGSTPTGDSTAKMSVDVKGTTQGIDLKISIDGLQTRTMEELPKK